MRPVETTPRRLFAALCALTLAPLLAACGTDSEQLHSGNETANQTQPSGRAADLGGTTAAGVEPSPSGSLRFTCPALDQAAPSSDQLGSFRSFCDWHNAELRANGYPACGSGQCAESWITETGGSRNAIELSVSYEPLRGGWEFSISYRLELGPVSRGRDRFLCRAVDEIWLREVRLEKTSWSFDRYLEFCVEGRSEEEE